MTDGFDRKNPASALSNWVIVLYISMPVFVFVIEYEWKIKLNKDPGKTKQKNYWFKVSLLGVRWLQSFI